MDREDWMCRGKHPYENYDRAKRQLEFRKVKRKGSYHKAFGCAQRLVVYRCRCCGHWHLGNNATKS